MRPNLVALGQYVRGTLTDTGKLQRVVGEIFDELTGLSTPVYDETFDGPLVIFPQDRSRDAEAGEAVWHISRYDVTFPAGTDVKVGDYLTISTSPDAPELVGQGFRIADAPPNSWEVSRQCVAETIES